MQLSDTLTAADLRAMRAVKQVQIYELSARVKIHPGRLGQYLSGALPLTPDVASRIAAALQSEEHLPRTA